MNMFKGLSNLYFLDLSENSIMNVSHGSFLGLDNLEELYMQSNKIFQIEAKTFVSLHSALAY